MKNPWLLSHRFDVRALRLADRHYSRQKPGTNQFVAPGRSFPTGYVHAEEFCFP
jgi:hypothetical protein